MNKHIKGTLAVLGALGAVSAFIMIAYMGWMEYFFFGLVGMVVLYFLGFILGSIYVWGMKLGKINPPYGIRNPHTAERLKARKKPSTRRKWKIVLPNLLKAPREKSND